MPFCGPCGTVDCELVLAEIILGCDMLSGNRLWGQLSCESLIGWPHRCDMLRYPEQNRSLTHTSTRFPAPALTKAKQCQRIAKNMHCRQKGYHTIWKRRGEIFESSCGSSDRFQSRMAPSCMLVESVPEHCHAPCLGLPQVGEGCCTAVTCLLHGSETTRRTLAKLTTRAACSSQMAPNLVMMCC